MVGNGSRYLLGAPSCDGNFLLGAMADISTSLGFHMKKTNPIKISIPMTHINVIYLYLNDDILMMIFIIFMIIYPRYIDSDDCPPMIFHD